MLFVTHDMREAFRLSDQLVILAGTPARVVRTIRDLLIAAERSSDAALELARAYCAGNSPS